MAYFIEQMTPLLMLVKIHTFNFKNDLKNIFPIAGIEPRTFSMRSHCSINCTTMLQMKRVPKFRNNVIGVILC
jgi:hypothetical protein